MVTPGTTSISGRRVKPARDTKAEIIQRRVAPDQQRHPPAIAEMSRDLSRPCRGNCIVPCVDTAAVIVTPGIALRQVELE